MEPLLGAFGGIDSVTRQYSERLQRDSTLEREQHESTLVEREEEHRLETGVGQGGAFGSRIVTEHGIEKVAWEYRSEDEHIGIQLGKKAASEKKDVADADTQEELAENVAHVPFKTPNTIAEAKALGKPVTEKTPPEQVVNGFRFVDVSSTQPSHQHWQVRQRAERRDKKKGRTV
jgi:hypothetical protein